MYSEELDRLVNNGIVNHIDYIKHFNAQTSPQIIIIHYNAWDDNFNVITNDGWEWNFKVEKGVSH